ncbi:hypothetical protein QTQ03_22700 [Micromonospora sp. WMMA1363]|uniref:hypothetical protein n=1 Tax=Micromonospora sp. WMMA1363 TaxID=3053985 RepID=UPI00259CA7CD|nr:hypothetical protein [Micromonospora sp. WMMA1363]MDM4722259.1 hypothetical protein [Micromonospora sp. WMMA1363]
MRWIHRGSLIECDHDGRVVNVASQRWVTIGGAPVLVDADPQGKAILGCPNFGPTIKPCLRTLRVTAGYSSWLRVDGQRVVLSNLDGLTDGSPPGLVHYTVRDPSQSFVEADA